MIRKIHPNDPKQSPLLLDLQRRAYQIEANLIDFQDIPPLRESLETLNQSQEEFWGWFEEENLVGVIAFEFQADALLINRLYVSPDLFRKGIGKKLLERAIRIARERGKNKVKVGTASANVPAINLYKKLGFQEVKVEKVSNILWYSSFQLEIS